MGQRRKARQWDGLCVSSIPPGCLLQGAGGAFFLCQNPGGFPGLPRTAAVLSSDGGPERRRGPLPEGLLPPSFFQHQTSEPPPIPSQFPNTPPLLYLCPFVQVSPPPWLSFPPLPAIPPLSLKWLPRAPPGLGTVHTPRWTAVSSCLRGLPCSRQTPLVEGLCPVPPVCPYCHAQCLLLVTVQDTHSGHLHATVQRSVPECPGRRRKGRAEKLQRHKSGFKFQLGTQEQVNRDPRPNASGCHHKMGDQCQLCGPR